MIISPAVALLIKNHTYPNELFLTKSIISLPVNYRGTDNEIAPSNYDSDGTNEIKRYAISFPTLAALRSLRKIQSLMNKYAQRTFRTHISDLDSLMKTTDVFEEFFISEGMFIDAHIFTITGRKYSSKADLGTKYKSCIELANLEYSLVEMFPGWANGYTATWDANHGESSTPNPVPYAPGASPSTYTGNGPNCSSACQTVQPVLIQSCSTLVLSMVMDH
jgi:hypothetical protein